MCDIIEALPRPIAVVTFGFNADNASAVLRELGKVGLAESEMYDFRDVLQDHNPSPLTKKKTGT